MAYFDNATTTYPKPESVYSFMDKFYREQGGNAVAQKDDVVAIDRQFLEQCGTLVVIEVVVIYLLGGCRNCCEDCRQEKNRDSFHDVRVDDYALGFSAW